MRRREGRYHRHVSTLAVRPVRVSSPWASDGAQTIDFLDWLIDGVSARELAAATSGHMTLLQDTPWVQEHRFDLLRRLRGDRLPVPTYTPTFHRTRLDRLLGRRGTPDAPFGAAFKDERVGLLFCFCGDLECPTLTAQIVIHDDTVEWRDIAWQALSETTVGETYGPVGSFVDAVFQRAPYETLINSLLAQTESAKRD